MTNQMQGEILYSGVSGYVYTPWMPVRGDVATYGVQVLASQGITLSWRVETRKARSPTVGPPLVNKTMISVDDFEAEIAGALEWVRYGFATSSGSSNDDFVLFRPLQPSWERDR